MMQGQSLSIPSTPNNLLSCKNNSWLPSAMAHTQQDGFCIITDVLQEAVLDELKTRMVAARKLIIAEIGEERLKRAGELNVLRLMMQYDPYFLKLLEVPELLAVVDETVSPTAIMHLQNGFILPSFTEGETPSVFQNNYHMDFPRVLNGYMCSINVLFAISDFCEQNGGTWVVPGSHQRQEAPQEKEIHQKALPITCPAGSIVVFDSTLWHSAGHNSSGKDRLAINHQFTRSYFKQQIDYVRALGEETVLRQPARTQQLLGYYTRVVTSLDEYYQPQEKRLYRKGQG